MDGKNVRLYYIVNARMPNKKAYGIQVAKMCEAFIEAGVELTLVVPRTRASRAASLKEFYALRVEVPTVILPNFDGYSSGRIAFLFSSLVFLISAYFYIAREKLRGTAVIYTVDIDSFSFSALPLFGLPVFAEMHTNKPSNLLLRYFFRRAAAIIPTNSEIKSFLQKEYGIDEDRLFVEPNGVDLASFSNIPLRHEARARLGLSPDARIALYTGRFFKWKGLNILATAARLAPEIEWYVVGGSADEFRDKTGVSDIPPSLHIAGECAHHEVPVWLAAADALVVLGTLTNEESAKYTSPMKVFEYMMARRPVVASATPALKSIIPADAALFYTPDNAQSLAQATLTALAVPAQNEGIVSRAAALAQEHSWAKRAKRIVALMDARIV